MSKGGGGGSSGKVDYPEYLKEIHGDILDHDGDDAPSSSVVDLYNAALTAGSPFSGETAYDPSTAIGAMTTELGLLATKVNAIDPDGDWEDFIDAAATKIDAKLASAAEINASVDAFSDKLDDIETTDTLPKFKAGLRNINAVMSSAFVIGQSNIQAFKARDVADYTGKLRLQVKMDRDRYVIDSASKLIEFTLSAIELKKNLTHYTTEIQRLNIVASKEEIDTQLTIDDLDAKWDLELVSYINNCIAAIAGASTVKDGLSGPSMLRSTLGGALSGGAAGFMMGGPPGAAVGAGIGALAGILG